MVLVTGGSGFVGSHLVRALHARGERIKALYHKNKPSRELIDLEGVDWVCADLLDVYEVASAMEGITDVYHCAAIVSFQKEDRDHVLHVNPESTANLVNEALDRGIRKMVYLSSVSAIGRSGDENKQITEAEEWGESGFNTAYGISKYMAEMEVWRGIGEGLNAAIVNPGIILGEGDWEKGSCELFKIAYKEFPFYTKGITAWADVQDVVKCMLLLMEADTNAERYIISSGNYSYKDIFNMMAKHLQKKGPRIYASSFFTGLIWRLGALKSGLGHKPAITKETAMNAHLVSKYDNSKLLKHHRTFTYTTIDRTIERVSQAFLRSIVKK